MARDFKHLFDERSSDETYRGLRSVEEMDKHDAEEIRVYTDFLAWYDGPETQRQVTVLTRRKDEIMRGVTPGDGAGFAAVRYQEIHAILDGWAITADEARKVIRGED